MKAKILSLILSAGIFMIFSVPALAITTETEGVLEQDGISASVDVYNKYVGDSTVKITAGSKILEEFKETGIYSAADTMVEIGSFDVFSETDFSGTITDLSVKLTGNFDKYFMEKIIIIHKYSDNFEVIPVSDIKPSGDKGFTLGFSTNYGLGKFSIAAAPSLTKEETAVPVSSAAAEASRPQSTAPPQLENQSSTSAAVIIGVSGAAVLLLIIMLIRRNRKK